MSRNVTSPPRVGLGAWSDAEIKRPTTQGVGRDGRQLQEPMPFAWYAGIRAEDLDAALAYLRTLPPLDGQSNLNPETVDVSSSPVGEDCSVARCADNAEECFSHVERELRMSENVGGTPPPLSEAVSDALTSSASRRDMYDCQCRDFGARS